VSYDLRLFPVPEGVEAKVAYEHLIHQEETEIVDVDQWARRLLPETSRARMQRLADALRTRWPRFVQFEPTSPLPWIELNDEDLQIQVSVYEQSASITMPYFRQHATEMMECVKCCLNVGHEHCGYVAYDPQLGRLVTADDADAIVHVYGGMDEALPGIQDKALYKKPWWKFW
jgi:hypothetical protein